VLGSLCGGVAPLPQAGAAVRRASTPLAGFTGHLCGRGRPRREHGARRGRQPVPGPDAGTRGPCPPAREALTDWLRRTTRCRTQLHVRRSHRGRCGRGRGDTRGRPPQLDLRAFGGGWVVTTHGRCWSPCLSATMWRQGGTCGACLRVPVPERNSGEPHSPGQRGRLNELPNRQSHREVVMPSRGSR